MRQRFFAISATFLCAATVACFNGPVRAGESTYPVSPPAVKPADTKWRFVFSPNGGLWVLQYLRHQSESHWNFGAEVEMEIARGKGHRLWFGARYELRAGFREEQEVTPFDPRHVDSYQLFTWRMAKRERREVFLHLRRVCYHEIDVHNPGASWTTHAALGIGTLSPPERGESLGKARKPGRAMLDGFVSIGPCLHGGPSDLFGNLREWEWESSVFLRAVYPVTGTLLAEGRASWNYLRTTLPESAPGSNRVKMGIAVTAQRNRGGVTLLIERILHDDYPLRREPVGWRTGLLHNF